jgi:plastocyanin
VLAETHEISNEGFAFVPDDVSIQVGDTVEFTVGSPHPVLEVSQETWENNGTTALSGGFSVPPGDGKVSFTETGTHYYVCENHVGSGMKGIIRVEEEGNGTSCQVTGFMDGNYTVNGQAYLEESEDGGLALRFTEQFSTSSGPDLDVYLSNSQQIDASSLLVAPLEDTAGAQSYDLPDSISMGDYSHVVVYCTEFSALWGYGEFEACTGTSIQGFPRKIPLAKLNIYLGHSSRLVIDNPGNAMNSRVIVFDILGRKLWEGSPRLQPGVNSLSNLVRSSIYIVRVQTRAQAVSRKLLAR